MRENSDRNVDARGQSFIARGGIQKRNGYLHCFARSHSTLDNTCLLHGQGESANFLLTADAETSTRRRLINRVDDSGFFRF